MTLVMHLRNGTVEIDAMLLTNVSYYFGKVLKVDTAKIQRLVGLDRRAHTRSELCARGIMRLMISYTVI